MWSTVRTRFWLISYGVMFRLVDITAQSVGFLPSAVQVFSVNRVNPSIMGRFNDLSWLSLFESLQEKNIAPSLQYVTLFPSPATDGRQSSSHGGATRLSRVMPTWSFGQLSWKCRLPRTITCDFTAILDCLNKNFGFDSRRYRTVRLVSGIFLVVSDRWKSWNS